jgi:PAS domain S-box-containing protein
MKDFQENTSQVVEILKKHPLGISIREIAASTSLNRMSVAKYLEVLMAKGIAEVRLFGSAKVYYLSRQIPVTAFIEYTTRHYCIMDSNLTVVQLNGWVPQTVGMVYEDMINRPILEVLKGRVVNLDECRIAMEKALAGEASTVIVENRYKDNHMFFEIFHKPVQFPDGSCGVMAVCQDISEKKHLEIALRRETEQFVDILNNLPAVVFSVDPEGVLTYINRKIAEYGFVPGDLIGRWFGDVIIPGERKTAMTLILSVQKSGTVSGIRFGAAARDGRTIRFEAECMVRMDDSGACTGICGILRDVSAEAGPVPGPAKR